MAYVNRFMDLSNEQILKIRFLPTASLNVEFIPILFENKL